MPATFCQIVQETNRERRKEEEKTQIKGEMKKKQTQKGSIINLNEEHNTVQSTIHSPFL